MKTVTKDRVNTSDRQSDTLKLQTIEDTEFTESLKPDLSQNLSELAGQFPELIHIIERWPTLPGYIKEAIKNLTQFQKNHTNTKEDY